ncbi:MAG: hypothetical protein KA477_00795 [Candidatus Levybacteria bacterium]|nr:hypothetical protein [Candidatus Levybacteria bacterium]
MDGIVGLLIVVVFLAVPAAYIAVAFNNKWLRIFIKDMNEFKGAKTEIRKGTIRSHRIVSILFAILVYGLALYILLTPGK